jgi:Sulfotransferase family
MISHKHKCIFVEVPKTGSTSVRAILGKAWKPHLNLWQIKQLMETLWTEFGERKNRIMAALYLLRPEERRREAGRRQFESYFKFGFVRNPWGRVVSLYERTEALQLRNEMDFEQFVDWIQYSSATCVHSSPHRYQLDWFVDANGNRLADFIGKFERLDENSVFVAQKLGVEKRCRTDAKTPGRVITLSIPLREQEISLQRSSK